jgi:hypothetical protein
MDALQEIDGPVAASKHELSHHLYRPTLENAAL